MSKFREMFVDRMRRFHRRFFRLNESTQYHHTIYINMYMWKIEKSWQRHIQEIFQNYFVVQISLQIIFQCEQLVSHRQMKDRFVYTRLPRKHENQNRKHRSRRCISSFCFARNHVCGLERARVARVRADATFSRGQTRATRFLTQNPEIPESHGSSANGIPLRISGIRAAGKKHSWLSQNWVLGSRIDQAFVSRFRWTFLQTSKL